MQIYYNILKNQSTYFHGKLRKQNTINLGLGQEKVRNTLYVYNSLIIGRELWSTFKRTVIIDRGVIITVLFV